MSYVTPDSRRSLRLRHLLLPLLCAFGGPVVAQTATWQTAVLVDGTQVTATATDASGNVYVTGYFRGTVTLGSTSLVSAGEQDVFVAKWSPALGSYVWAYRAGNAGNEQANAITIQGANVYIGGSFGGLTTSFGNNVLTNTSSTAASYHDMFVVKLVDAGTSARFEWAQQAWGRYDESCTKLVARGNQIYVVGSMVGTPPPSGPNSPGCNSCPNEVRINSTTLSTLGPKADGILAKLVDAGSSASFAWATQISGGADDRIEAVAVQGADIYLVGTSDKEVFLHDWSKGIYILNLTSYQNKGYVVKLTEDNNTVTKAWAQPIQSSGAAQVASVAVVGASVYVSGSFSGTLALGGGSILSAGGDDMFVAKLTNAGNSVGVAWVRGAGGAGYDTGSMLAASGKSIYLTGSFTNTATFGGSVVQSVGPNDTYIAKLNDQEGATDFMWVQQVGGTGDVLISDLYVDKGSLRLSGSVKTPATFGSIALQSGPNIYWPSYYQPGFFAELADPVLLPVASAKRIPLGFYPNPVHTVVHIPEGGSSTALTLLDGLGRAIRQGQGTTLSVQDVAPGLYVLQAATPGQPVRTARVVVE